MRSLIACPSVAGKSHTAVSHLNVRGKAHPPDSKCCKLSDGCPSGQKYVQLSEGHPLACAVPNPVGDAVIPSITMPFLVLVQPFVTTGCFS